MPDPALSPELDLLAAELAAGALDGDERLRALRLQLADRGFRMAVLAWQERLAPLFDAVPDVAPGAQTWPKIEAQLDDRAPARAVRQLRAWRLGTFAASAVAAGLALMLVVEPAPPPPPQFEIAQLVSKSGAPLLVAQYDKVAGLLRVRAALPEAARVPELWVIPAGGVPHSLGLISRSGNSDLLADAQRRALLQPGSVLAVTLEPADGAPHSAPTGEILASAPLTTL